MTLKVPPKVLTGNGDDDSDGEKPRVKPNLALFEAIDLFVFTAMVARLDDRILDLVYSHDSEKIHDVFVAFPSDSREGEAIRLGLRSIVTDDEGSTGFTGDWSYVVITDEVKAAYTN